MVLSKINTSLQVVAAIFLGACGQADNTTSPIYKTLTESVYASGNVSPKNEYRIFAMAEGYLVKKMVLEGDSIQVNQPLFALKNDQPTIRLQNSGEVLRLAQENYAQDSPILQELRVAIETAKTKMQNDSVQYMRYKNLWEYDATSKAEFDRISLLYQTAKNELQIRKVQFDKTKNQLRLELKNAQSNYQISADDGSNYVLKSKINGVIYETYKEEGETVKRGEVIALVGSKHEAYIRLSIDETDIDKIKIGQKTWIKIDVYKGRVFQAKISKIYTMLNKQEQSFRVDAEFVGEKPEAFSGLTVEGNIIIQKKEKALVIPKSALISEDSVIVRHNRKDKKIKIHKGIENYEFVEIVQGLNDKDILIQK